MERLLAGHELECGGSCGEDERLCTMPPDELSARPLQPSPKKTLDIYLISDSSEVQDMTGSLMFIDSTGYITFHSVYHGLKDSFHAPGQQSVQLASIPWDSLAGQTMLEFELSIPGWVVTYSTVYFIRPPNEASLKPAAITQQYVRSDKPSISIPMCRPVCTFTATKRN